MILTPGGWRFFALAGIDGQAHLQDVVGDPPTEEGDVALLMKASPCLERQQAGSTSSLLDAVRTRHAVVTYPVRSLGQRAKGMPERYAASLRDMLRDRPWAVARLDLDTELVFVIDKGSEGQ